MAVQQVQYGLDKDGKMVPSLIDPLAFIENWFQESVESQAGAATLATNEAMISIEVPAGAVFIIMNIIATYFSTISLDGRLVVYQSTTAAVGGTNVLLADIPFSTVKAAGPLGTTDAKHLKGEQAPVAIVDNKAGSVSVYLNIEIPAFVSDATQAIVANAITQVYSCAINGAKYL